MKSLGFTLTLTALAWFGAGPAAGQRAELAVAAASDLQAVFPDLARGFERAAGIRAIPSFGSSGSFFAQVQNGAPFDVFMSADADYPRKLAASGHVEGRTLTRYAIGHIVVWTRKDSGIDISRGIEGLNSPRVRRIAIANPDVAPYGRAAVAALRSARVYDSMRDRLVIGENIAQTAQLADSGNADVAIIGLSLALGPVLRSSGAYVPIPGSLHPSIDQAAGLITASPRRDQARRFLSYLTSPEARATFERFGFEAPPHK